MSLLRLSAILSLLLTLPAVAQKKKDEPEQRTDAEILKSVKLPEGYEATVFASPPQLGYPTAVCAAPDGTLFVAVDENGSLGRNRNKADKPRGYVMRLRDTDGDGKADEFKKFAEMESPRGVIWDAPSGTVPGTLYVMHPPNLTAYTDTNGDGVADKQEEILTGLGFGLDFRGADHTTNGCRLGIDGFIYIAMGDYGAVEAKGKDGATIKHRGGGVVRIRPDGTGLELVTAGTRNIYDVAVSPTLDLFTRDNTNDGGGWNVRLSYIPPGAHMGYPTLFINFPEDHVQPLADLGGGSPCGSIWLDEPGLPKGLFTVEWGVGGIMSHENLTPDGAGWKLTGNPTKQTKWISLTRPTDINVDAAGRLYVASWEGATFDYNGPNAGYVLRVQKKDLKPAPAPNVKQATDAQLAQAVGSPSGVIREAALREMLRRGPKPDFAASLRKIAETPGDAGPRVAAIQALRQIYGVKALAALAQLCAIDDIREYAITALGDDTRLTAQVPTQPLVAGLADKNPRVRSASITALRRLGKADAAASILPLVADADPIIAHQAVRALSDLKASQVCLGALDSADEKVKPGALKALYGINDAATVDGLIARLPAAQGGQRKGIVNALCRLAMVDGPYLDPKEWWGTRPDTSGPVYKPVKWAESGKIETTLKQELARAEDAEALWLAQRLMITKVDLPDLSSVMLAKSKDAPAKLAAIHAMTTTKPGLNDDAITVLLGIVSDEKQAPALRASALREIQRSAEWERELNAGLAALAGLAAQPPSDAALASAVDEFTHDTKLVKLTGELKKAAAGSDKGKAAAAQTILVNLASSSIVKDKERKKVEDAIAELWQKPETAAGLLGAIARTKAQNFTEQVRAHLKDPNNAVAESALFAYQALGLNDSGPAMKKIGEMTPDMVASIVNKGGGDAVAGKEMFLRAGCIACHTITADEPPKGPVLSAVAKIYDRAALTEWILKPNAKLAQGFESTWIKTKKGDQIEGFITREGGDSLDIRNVAAQTVTVEKGDIAERGTRDQSMMPEGLLNAFTPAELSNLLAYLESLKK